MSSWSCSVVPEHTSCSFSLARLNAQALNALKMVAVIRQKSEIVLQRCRSDQEIHIADHHACSPQTSTLPAKNFRGLFVHTDQRYTLQKVIELLLTLLCIARTIDAFIE